MLLYFAFYSPMMCAAEVPTLRLEEFDHDDWPIDAAGIRSGDEEHAPSVGACARREVELEAAREVGNGGLVYVAPVDAAWLGDDDNQHGEFGYRPERRKGTGHAEGR